MQWITFMIQRQSYFNNWFSIENGGKESEMRIRCEKDTDAEQLFTSISTTEENEESNFALE